MADCVFQIDCLENRHRKRGALTPLIPLGSLHVTCKKKYPDVFIDGGTLYAQYAALLPSYLLTTPTYQPLHISQHPSPFRHAIHLPTLLTNTKQLPIIPLLTAILPCSTVRHVVPLPLYITNVHRPMLVDAQAHSLVGVAFAVSVAADFIQGGGGAFKE